jgi:hypothetical protein
LKVSTQIFNACIFSANNTAPFVILQDFPSGRHVKFSGKTDENKRFGGFKPPKTSMNTFVTVGVVL